MKQILFNTDMVRAILDGRKTATRRVVKPQPRAIYHDGTIYEDDGYYVIAEDQNGALEQIGLPYHPGDILYVRETWTRERNQYYYRTDFESDFLDPCETLSGGYPAECAYHPGCEGCYREPTRIRWHPSIHMPKEAARLFLRVTEVRVERLQDMTEDDALTEGYDGRPWCEHKVWENYPDSPVPCYGAGNPGCPLDPPCNHSILESFGMEVWDSTIKPADLNKYGWDANPWVWVIEFERISREAVLEGGTSE